MRFLILFLCFTLLAGCARHTPEAELPPANPAVTTITLDVGSTVDVAPITLDDGTRCVIARTGSGVALDCYWKSHF